MAEQGRTYRVGVLGLHDTGKSTYVGALFIALESPAVETMLSLKNYSGSRRYVNTLADALRGGEEIGRTKSTREGEFVATLVDPEGNEFELSVPDWSGEAIERGLRDRALRADVATALAKCDGVLLFVHPDAVVEVEEIRTAEKWLEGLREIGVEVPTADELDASDSSPGESDAGKLPSWRNDYASTDLKLVDALQEIVTLAGAPLRVAVVVSAWDVAKQDHETPDEWLARQLPLLSQFLEANAGGLFEFIVFGVSAQGRSFKGKLDPEFLATDAALRVHVEGDDAPVFDMTAPIAWLRG